MSGAYVYNGHRSLCWKFYRPLDLESGVKNDVLAYKPIGTVQLMNLYLQQFLEGYLLQQCVPPASPPPGPKSIIVSALHITSKLCSIATTVFPFDTSFFKISSSLSTSCGCNPVVGSSNKYKVFPVSGFDNSVANLIRCASPPDNVEVDCPNFKIFQTNLSH